MCEMSNFCAKFNLFAVKPLIQTFQLSSSSSSSLFFLKFLIFKTFFFLKFGGGVGEIKLGYQIWDLGYQFNTKCRESRQPHKSGLFICSYGVPTSC
jgi:hypothetical protein